VEASSSDWHRALGDALREARHARGISQERLGLDADIHRNYVGGIERGQRKPTVECIIDLASELKVGVAELFVRAGELMAERQQPNADPGR
jgi:transcriptional regulator with XRE-family HTH domain